MRKTVNAHVRRIVRAFGWATFRGVAPAVADENPRAVVERTVRELLRALALLSSPPTLRVTDAEGGVACLVQV